MQLEELQHRKVNNVPDNRKSVNRSALPVSSHNILTSVKELRNQQQSNSELRKSTVESNNNEELKERQDKNKGKRLKQNPKNDSRTRHTISKVGQFNYESSSDGTVKKKTGKNKLLHSLLYNVIGIVDYVSENAVGLTVMH